MLPINGSCFGTSGDVAKHVKSGVHKQKKQPWEMASLPVGMFAVKFRILLVNHPAYQTCYISGWVSWCCHPNSAKIGRNFSKKQNGGKFNLAEFNIIVYTELCVMHRIEESGIMFFRTERYYWVNSCVIPGANLIKNVPSVDCHRLPLRLSRRKK